MRTLAVLLPLLCAFGFPVSASPIPPDKQLVFPTPPLTLGPTPSTSPYGDTRVFRPFEGSEEDKREPLRNLQVHHPPVVPEGGKSCRVELLRHDFASSYYKPAVADYTPPTGCGHPGSWAAVVLNLTVTSNGTQFDRLGSISLGHVEIWRTSTAEPTRSGIIWTYEKDVTRFSPLFAKPGRLLFELNNLLTDRYTGIFSTILSATFYEPTADFPTPPSADLILPVTTGSKEGSQMLVYPGDASANLTLPDNAAEAWLEVIATGAAEEEFWYTNILDRWRDYWTDADVSAKGPLREVQVLVDGVVAGVVYPFPVIYTGGANPLLWRPLASLRAFDVPSAFVDISPFLGSLSDGSPHEISFRVYGQGEAGSVNENWFITGALHILLDPTTPPVRTTGRLLGYDITPEPLILSAGFPSPDHESLKTVVQGTRSVNVIGELKTGSGTRLVHWGQAVTLENKQVYRDEGNYEDVAHSTSVITTSTHSGALRFRERATFALAISTNYTLISSGIYTASLPEYIYNRALTLPSALGGTGGARITRSRQEGWAEVCGRKGNFSLGRGEMEEVYEYKGERGETYWEETKAVNASIVSRNFGGTLARLVDAA